MFNRWIEEENKLQVRIEIQVSGQMKEEARGQECKVGRQEGKQVDGQMGKLK